MAGEGRRDRRREPHQTIATGTDPFAAGQALNALTGRLLPPEPVAVDRAAPLEKLATDWVSAVRGVAERALARAARRERPRAVYGR
jgi:hypothetical protein